MLRSSCKIPDLSVNVEEHPSNLPIFVGVWQSNWVSRLFVLRFLDRWLSELLKMLKKNCAFFRKADKFQNIVQDELQAYVLGSWIRSYSRIKTFYIPCWKFSELCFINYHCKKTVEVFSIFCSINFPSKHLPV